MNNSAISKVNNVLNTFIEKVEIIEPYKLLNYLEDESQLPLEIERILNSEFDSFSKSINRSLKKYLFGNDISIEIAKPKNDYKGNWSLYFKNITDFKTAQDSENEIFVNSLNKSNNIKKFFIFFVSFASLLLLIHSIYWLWLIIPLFIGSYFLNENINIESARLINSRNYSDECSFNEYKEETILKYFKEHVLPIIKIANSANKTKVTNLLNNDKVNFAWDFYDKGINIIKSFDDLPGSLSTFALSNFIGTYEANKIADLHEAEQIRDEEVSLFIEEMIKEKSIGLEEKINSRLTQNIKDLIEKYLNYAKDMANKVNYNNSMAISKKDVELIIENSLKDTLKISGQLNVSTANMELVTNTLIGAGAIGAGVLSGGAGVALIASGPIGWIAGAIIGGLALSKGKNVIKGALKFLGLGINRKKINSQIKEIRSEFSNKVQSSIRSQTSNIKSKLSLVNYNIAKAIAYHESN